MRKLTITVYVNEITESNEEILKALKLLKVDQEPTTRIDLTKVTVLPDDYEITAKKFQVTLEIYY